MKLKCTFESIDMGDEIIYVPVGKEAANINGILKMNKTGHKIISLLEKETTEQSIVEVLVANYNNDRNSIEQYVKYVLDKLRAASLLDE